VAVLARSLKHGKRARIDLSFSQNGMVASGNAWHPEWMNQRAPNRDDRGNSRCDENLSDHRVLPSLFARQLL
jgi:hypothetical protein